MSWMHWRMKKTRISFSNIGESPQLPKEFAPHTRCSNAPRLTSNFHSQKRLAELSTLRQTSLFNQVYPLQKVDYAREVTEASNNAFVLVNLTSQGANVESRVLTELWRQLAAKFGDIKFCEIRADMCIEGYPEKNTPTILVYKDTEIKRQLITLRELNGPRTKVEDLERLLIDIGALKESDVRLKKRSDDEEDYRKTGDDELKIEDYDDDWD